MRKAIDAVAGGLELIAPQGVEEPLIAKPFYTFQAVSLQNKL